MIDCMSEIVLATINARFIHTAFGLRYLHANMGELQERCVIREFDTAQSAKEIAEILLGEEPKIIGFGVYIWNTVRTRQVVSVLKQLRPELIIVLGGPEVSYEYDDQPLVALADYLITGEADLAFVQLCRTVLSGVRPADKIINARLPELATLTLPYQLYSDADISNRVVYVEVSRGCPFTCEFCLSSVDIPVRQFDTAAVLEELDQLYKRGSRVFKFVDRTFNLNVRTSNQILEFFLDRMTPGLFVHFEMVPDRFPQALRDTVAKFPPGSLQLEVGVQSLNPRVGELIRRRQDVDKLFDNLRYLRQHTHAHLHVDLIVGLPGEDLASFGRGFDALVRVDPHEIQVGILKRLRGTPIVRHTGEYELKFSDEPPYEILSTRDISFFEVQRMERFSRYWDLVANSGNFVESRALLWHGMQSPFEGFMQWSEWLFSKVGRRSSIELKLLTELVFEFLVSERGVERTQAGSALTSDYQRGGRSDVPAALREFSINQQSVNGHQPKAGLKRQARFVGHASGNRL
jgi:radical SAM superfamily enzyme YgiQ (UPF0313 family)